MFLKLFKKLIGEFLNSFFCYMLACILAVGISVNHSSQEDEDRLG
jgi:hypothetical protein